MNLLKLLIRKLVAFFKDIVPVIVGLVAIFGPIVKAVSIVVPPLIGAEIYLGLVLVTFVVNFHVKALLVWFPVFCPEDMALSKDFAHLCW